MSGKAGEKAKGRINNYDVHTLLLGWGSNDMLQQQQSRVLDFLVKYHH